MGKEGPKVSQAHLNYIHPFPRNLGAILKRFETVIVAELNLGQLVVLLRNAYPEVRFKTLSKIKGQPFKVYELALEIKKLVELETKKAEKNSQKEPHASSGRA